MITTEAQNGIFPAQNPRGKKGRTKRIGTLGVWKNLAVKSISKTSSVLYVIENSGFAWLAKTLSLCMALLPVLLSWFYLNLGPVDLVSSLVSFYIQVSNDP